MSLRSPREALNWAAAESRSRSRDWTGWCLVFTRSCFNVASRYSNAEVAYFATNKKHTSWPPPAGVPIWWTNGKFGHVALSAGDGWCWSTDFLRTGHVDKVRIASITAGWGQRYRGWSEDINEVTVWTRRPVVDLSGIQRAQRRETKSPQSRRVKRAVAAEVGKGNMQLNHGILGGGFKEQYAKVQEKYLRSIGERPNPRTADGVPGYGSLKWLGQRHGFDVRR